MHSTSSVLLSRSAFSVQERDSYSIYFHSVVLKFFLQFWGFGLCGETVKMVGGPMNLEHFL